MTYKVPTREMNKAEVEEEKEGLTSLGGRGEGGADKLGWRLIARLIV